MDETWKSIDGFEDYMISNYGRVKSLKFGKEKILKYIKNNKKYLYVDLCIYGICHRKQISILVYEIFYNHKLKSDECVHHKDENINNNYIKNLQKMTKSEHNTIHKFGKSHPMLGKYHSRKIKKKIMISSNHKLSEKNIDKIKILLKENKLIQTKIAKIFDVSQSTVSDIKHNKIWKYLEGK